MANKCTKSKPALTGRLKHRITIQAVTRATDSVGQQGETWADHLTARAAIEPLIGKEYFQAYQEQSANMVRFRLRYSSALSAVNPRDHRIKYNSQTYDIKSVTDVFTQHKEIIIMAELHNG